MSQNDVEKIKERLDIKDVVETYVKVEKAGKNYKARCPFHNEKTPSFLVSPDRGTYYCFGCGAKGDIFSFVQEFEGVDFPQALNTLADRAGIKLQKRSPEAESRTKRFREILDMSTKFFEFQLERNPEAMEYLTTRGLTEDTIKEWRIGFAPEGWQNLRDSLIDKGYKEEEIERTGMIKKGERGKCYDTFRNRIMFPIFDTSGNVVAFSGRIFGPDDETAKYINSPETELFKKSEILYGFHVAKTGIRKNDFSILVEGQMDLLMAQQAGYVNTVASSGTALTEQQLEIISRISPKVVIAYDADGAGFKAAEKAWQMALSLGMDVKIAPIPEGEDPAEIIKKDKDGWREVIKGSKHIIEILITNIMRRKLDDRAIGQAVSSEIMPYLMKIDSEIDKAHFVNMVSQNLKVSEKAIYSDLERLKRLEPGQAPVTASSTDGGTIKAAVTRESDSLAVEKRILGVISWQKSIPEKDRVLDPEKVSERAKSVMGDRYDQVEKAVADSLEDISSVIGNSYEDLEKMEKVVNQDIDEMLTNLEIKYLTKQREELLLSLRAREQAGDEDGANSLLKEIGDISQKIQKINL